MDERTTKSETLESSKNLYADYRNWAESRGGRPMSQMALSLELETKGFLKDRNKHYRGFYLQLQPLQQRAYFDEA
jgi:phage/plasmid-associated DNA primase